MRMATLGLNEAQAMAVADMLTAVETATAAGVEAGREKARERWRKWDAKRRSNVGKRLQTSANNSRAVEDKPLPTDIEPQVKKTSHGDVDAFRAGLTPDVSEEVLSEFVKVRRKKRGALTGYAATLFREDAAKCGMSVADAAKECVRSSWITVKPEYFAGRQRAGPAPPKPRPVEDVIVNLLNRMGPANAEPASKIEGHPEAPRRLSAGQLG